MCKGVCIGCGNSKCVCGIRAAAYRFALRENREHIGIADVYKLQMDRMKDLSLRILARLEDTGRAQERLRQVLDNEVFENLSKHNPYWDSEHEKEAEKLNDIRLNIASVSEELYEIWGMLKTELPDL
jgi:hypothetical protein